MTGKMTGTGSTLAILVFSVLCLTIFSLISFSAAEIDKSLSEAAAQTVIGYYEADLLAERIIAEILDAEDTPVTIMGVSIFSSEGNVSFACPISDNKSLFVEIELLQDTYKINEWRMLNNEEWEKDSNLPVWSGD